MHFATSRVRDFAVHCLQTLCRARGYGHLCRDEAGEILERHSIRTAIHRIDSHMSVAREHGFGPLEECCRSELNMGLAVHELTGARWDPRDLFDCYMKLDFLNKAADLIHNRFILNAVRECYYYGPRFLDWVVRVDRLYDDIKYRYRAYKGDYHNPMAYQAALDHQKRIFLYHIEAAKEMIRRRATEHPSWLQQFQR